MLRTGDAGQRIRLAAHAAVRHQRKGNRFFSVAAQAEILLRAHGDAMRRKTLLNNLVSGFSLNREQAAACLAAANLSAQARAEELSLEDFAGLAIQLQNTIR